VTLTGDVACERVQAVGPPETGAVVMVEGNRLLRKRFGSKGLHREVAVEDVADLGAVLQEEAMALAAVADAIANHQVIRAVDGQPAIAAVPNRRPDDRNHGVYLLRRLSRRSSLPRIPRMPSATAMIAGRPYARGFKR